MERRIRLIREMLQRTGETQSSPQSPIIWETTFDRIANALNDLPTAKGNNSNSQTERFDVITPNRLLLGRGRDWLEKGSILGLVRTYRRFWPEVMLSLVLGTKYT